MSLMPIRIYGDPVLSRKAKPVDPVDPELPGLVKSMLETMVAARGVGLAANQVGLARALVVINTTGGEDPSADLVLLNPQILELQGEVEELEGCLSLPDPASEADTPIQAKTRRAAFCRAKAQGLDGKWFEVAGDGMLGKALQHEIDHLNGILFVDRVSLAQRALLSGKLKALKKRSQGNKA